MVVPMNEDRSLQEKLLQLCITQVVFLVRTIVIQVDGRRSPWWVRAPRSRPHFRWDLLGRWDGTVHVDGITGEDGEVSCEAAHHIEDHITAGDRFSPVIDNTQVRITSQALTSQIREIFGEL